MLSFKRIRHRPNLYWPKQIRFSLNRLFVVALLMAPVVLSACGFQPLYGRSETTGQSAVDTLATVRIAPLPDRIGQQLHNLLRDRLNPLGQPRKPNYILQVVITESKEDLGIRKDETATRANLTITANFALHDIGTDQELLRSVGVSTNSYNILDDQFATTVSENDARERALRELSEDIRTRLAVFFSSAQQQS